MQGHEGKGVSVTKRWWICASCNHQFSTLGVKYPKKRCPNPRYGWPSECPTQLVPIAQGSSAFWLSAHPSEAVQGWGNLDMQSSAGERWGCCIKVDV